MTRSLASLAQYLTKPAKDDREKARALFRWIAANIEYDAEAFFSGDIQPQTADEALRERKGVCAGYSGLFEALADHAGLEVATVAGIGRGYSMRPGDPLPEESNHDWTAVKLDGEWHLLDSTWGAGYLDDQGRFVRELEDFWFLTPPEQFLNSHLPEDSKWQLVDPPLDRKAFNAQPHLDPVWFRHGLRLESPAGGALLADGPLKLEVAAPEELKVSGVLLRNGEELPDSAVFVQRREGGATLRALFPEAGGYVLRLFAGPRAAESIPTAAEFVVRAAKATPGASFPETYGAYEKLQARLVRPMSGSLRAGQAVEFQVEVPGALAVMVQTSAGQDRLVQDGDGWSGRIAPGAGEVFLGARMPGQESYQGLARFVAR